MVVKVLPRADGQWGAISSAEGARKYHRSRLDRSANRSPGGVFIARVASSYRSVVVTCECIMSRGQLANSLLAKFRIRLRPRTRSHILEIRPRNPFISRRGQAGYRHVAAGRHRSPTARVCRIATANHGKRHDPLLRSQQALARQVGEHSPLFKKLSPTDSEGLTKNLEGAGVEDVGRAVRSSFTGDMEGISRRRFHQDA